MTHSLYLASSNVEQVRNPWSSRGEDLSLTATATNRQRGETDPAFRSHTVAWQDRDMIISPSPPPPSDRPMHARPPMQATDTVPTETHVASLKAIFPDFDDAVIRSVLDSTNNDHDRALDLLLGMNDPSFVPPNPPPAQSPNSFQSAPSVDAQRLSQEALDEQLARRLALEEQQAAQAWQPQGVEGQGMYQPYQPRRGARNGWGGQPQYQPQAQGPGARDTMTDFQDGFNRIAESGKKTFSSLVSKVRSKMQDFDQGQGWSWNQNGSSNKTATASQSYAPGQSSGQAAYAQPYQSAQSTTPQWQTSQPQMGSYMSSPPRSGVLSSAATAPVESPGTQQSSYYDPNARGYDLYDDEPEEEIRINDGTTHTPSTDTAAPAVVASATATTQNAASPPHGDNVTTPPPPSDTSPLSSYASAVANPLTEGQSPPARSFSPAMTGVRSATPGAPGGVDFSKLGLLPKRPISLVRSQSPPSTGDGVGAPRVAVAHSQSTTDSSTDHEEPEFVENPFEDPK